MKYPFRSFFCCISLAIVLLASGCSKEPIRYLNSDACLIAQGTTKKDVLTFLGTPKFTRTTESSEIWTFVQEHKSLLKKTPLLSRVGGSISYDLVFITFSGDIVTNCQYRLVNEEEYQKSLFDQDQTPASK